MDHHKKKKRQGAGKERRAAVKAEKTRLAAAQVMVDNANALENPLSKFPIFHKFDRNEIVCNLECKRRKDMDEETLEWAIGLTKANMQSMYEESNWGWNEAEKRDEMTEDSAWYLIARDASTEQPVAFTHFRFDMDYGDEVLYCYELQLEKSYRERGLGRFFMQVLELMAFSNQMKKVVLTVFNHNKEAMAFYKKCKYEVDETSLEDNEEETFDYKILSKINKIKSTLQTSL